VTRLGELTEAGLLTRSIDGGPPLSVAYELSESGRALLPALEQIGRWADQHLPPAVDADEADVRPPARRGRDGFPA